jgi:hypothetical protein
MIFLLLACSGSTEPTTGDGDTAATSLEFPCDDPSRQVHADISDRDPATRTFVEGVVIDGVWVSALEGCEDISGSLAAMNWYSVSDVDAATAYSNAVMPLLIDSGAKILFSGNGTEPAGPEDLVLHDVIAVPLYLSAEAFVDMVASEEFMSVVHYKEEGVADEYSFGFQRCLVGCEDLPESGVLPAISVPALVHHFTLDDVVLEDHLDALSEAIEADGAGQLAYAGKLIASGWLQYDDGSLHPFYDPMGVEGSLIIALDDVEDAARVLALPEYASFLELTPADVAVTASSWF